MPSIMCNPRVINAETGVMLRAHIVNDNVVLIQRCFYCNLRFCPDHIQFNTDINHLICINCKTNNVPASRGAFMNTPLKDIKVKQNERARASLSELSELLRQARLNLRRI